MNLSVLSLKSSKLLLICCCFSVVLHTQNDSPDQKSGFWKNVSFGGGLGLGFANGFFSATIAPQAVYNFNSDFALGIGLNGTINNREDVFKSTILGGSLIGLYNPINEIQLSAEFEQLNIDQNFDEDFVLNSDRNFWNSALFLGAGYRTGNMIFGIRYDVLYDEEDSIYADPWIPFVRFWF